MSDEEAQVASEESGAEETPKKGRGRPKKEGSASAEKRKADPAKKDSGEPKEKRGRGRPPSKGGAAAAKKPAAGGKGRGRGRPKKN